MERNHNPNVVVMAKEQYEQLLSMARVSQRYDPKRIDQHVRKFNPYRQADHQATVLKWEAHRSQQIRDARAFKEQHVGKLVYARVDMHGNTKGDDPVLMPVIVKRVSKDRRCVDVVEANDEFKQIDRHYTKVSVDTLCLDVPDGYIQGVESYSKYLIKENGPYDIREVVKERDRKHEKWLAEEAIRKSNLNEPISVDVIGER